MKMFKEIEVKAACIKNPINYLKKAAWREGLCSSSAIVTGLAKGIEFCRLQHIIEAVHKAPHAEEMACEALF